MIHWNEIRDDVSPEELSELSNTDLLLIFKHSTRCGTSYMALDRLTEQWDSEKVEGLRSCFLDVISYRELAREIGAFFKVPHQSPQLLLIRNGECIFESSHSGIKFSDVEAVMRKLNG